ncbi:antitermination protein N [Dryocola sp. BD613]|uniref:antitermination protein N n=1 Tax=Dryocola sp. BD613 TaxID=3133272 RepID=UPI003F4F5978
MDAQARRRQRREAKQLAWKAANPLLVGISARPVTHPPLVLNRKPEDRIAKALEVINEYGLQIIQNAERYQKIRRQQDSITRRIYQSSPQTLSGEAGASGKEKRHGKSRPLI